jgi:hypothetical protein
MFVPRVAAAAGTEFASADIEFFEQSIRPLLVERCLDCHAGDAAEANLQLDSRDGMLRGGDSGPAVVIGRPDESLLISAVHYSNDRQMPPDGKLAPQEIEALSEWVSRGAPWPEVEKPSRPTLRSKFAITDEDRAHWAFQPIRGPAEPPVSDAAWLQTSIDRFILARLEAEGLAPSPRADKRTLLRRATFALTGLPPTPAEVEDFLADDSQEAFARVVDRLLASPHYGERWARHWLDVARYGEDQAHTFEARLYTQGFRYRDWLIRALNDDMPYDEFLRQQLAADLIGTADRSNRNLPALGFFAIGPVYYGDRKMLDQMDDRIDTITRGLLGLTVACARCHDHKFDPISTADYYALAGVVASTEYVEVPLVTDEEAKAAKRAEAERIKRTNEKKKKNAPPPYDFVHAIREAKPVDMAIHVRGNAENLGPVTPRRFLTVLTDGEPRPFHEGSGRLELARAIASPDNPLTARVIVNRVWRLHFGRGLVATPSNFGRLAEPPTHPELLDHLASKFIASGWSLKWLHREIMLSAAYQQSSRMREDGWAIDPDNRWVWRMNRRRLEVEPWRDAILAVAGTLNDSIGGPSFDLADPDNHRRTLYARVSRHELNPLLRLFDFPDPNITSDGRPITTAPLQQLFVMNSEFMVASARAFAARICAVEADDPARVTFAIEQAFGRPPTDEELQLGVDFIASTTRENSTNDPATLTPWEQYAQALLSTNEFMYID